MEAGGINFALQGIATLLSERGLAVPIYQRSYAWTRDEIEEFWTDLRSAFSESESEYFLGTLVLTRQGQPPRDSIIDGQQRLATTLILLAAIRDEYKIRGDEKRGSIVQAFLSIPDLQSGDEMPRLSLNSEDAYF